MPITIIPDTGVNNIYVNQNTGLNIVLSGVSAQNSVNISGAGGAITPHNNLNGLQGGSSSEYYHLSKDQFDNIVTGQAVDTGLFYPINNPSGFITGVDLSNYYTIDNPSGYITGIDQISFSVLLHTGIEETGIVFPYTFSSQPRVFADLALISDTGYLVGIKNISITGYTAVFSDIIEETGIYLQTLITNL